MHFRTGQFYTITQNVSGYIEKCGVEEGVMISLLPYEVTGSFRLEPVIHIAHMNLSAFKTDIIGK